MNFLKGYFGQVSFFVEATLQAGSLSTGKLAVSHYSDLGEDRHQRGSDDSNA